MAVDILVRSFPYTCLSHSAATSDLRDRYDSRAYDSRGGYGGYDSRGYAGYDSRGGGYSGSYG